MSFFTQYLAARLVIKVFTTPVSQRSKDITNLILLCCVLIPVLGFMLYYNASNFIQPMFYIPFLVICTPLIASLVYGNRQANKKGKQISKTKKDNAYNAKMKALYNAKHGIVAPPKSASPSNYY